MWWNFLLTLFLEHPKVCAIWKYFSNTLLRVRVSYNFPIFEIQLGYMIFIHMTPIKNDMQNFGAKKIVLAHAQARFLFSKVAKGVPLVVKTKVWLVHMLKLIFLTQNFACHFLWVSCVMCMKIIWPNWISKIGKLRDNLFDYIFI